jgi:hypothetical protein
MNVKDNNQLASFLNCRSRVRFAPGSLAEPSVTTKESAHICAPLVAGAETSSPSFPQPAREASGNERDSTGRNVISPEFGGTRFWLVGVRR